MFGIGTGSDNTDAAALMNAFLNGNVESTDVTSMIFGDESNIGTHIHESQSFQNFTAAFQNEFMQHYDDPNYNLNITLSRLAPDLTSDLYLHTVMGGYQYLEANVSISGSQITFAYNFVDHFGAGVGDSGSLLPGLSSMYYLQHNYGTSQSYTPFVWEVSVINTVSK